MNEESEPRQALPARSSGESERLGEELSRRIARRVTVGYVLILALWVYISDYAIPRFLELPVQFSTIEIAAHLAFMAISSAALYAVLRLAIEGGLRRSLGADGKAVKAERRHLPRFLPYGVFGALVLGVGLAGYLLFTRFALDLKEERQQELLAIMELKAAEIRAWHWQRLQSIQTLMRDADFDQALKQWLAHHDDRVALARVQRRLASEASSPEVDAAYLLDDRGITRLVSTPTLESLPASAAADAVQAMRDRSPTLTHIETRDDRGMLQLRIGLVQPIVLAAGESESAGALVFAIDPEVTLLPMLDTWPTPRRAGEAVLVRKAGDQVIFLTHPRIASDSGVSLQRSQNEPELLAAKVVRGENGVLEGLDYRGIAVIGAGRAISGTPWFLITKIDLAEIELPLARRALLTTVLALVFLLASSLAIVLWWRQQQARLLARHFQESAAREAEARHFEILSRFASELVLLVDDTGCIAEANPRALAALGGQGETIVGRNLDALVGVPACTCVIPADGATGGECQTTWRNTAGKPFPVEVASHAIEIDGRFFTQVIARDISERVAAAEALRKSEERFRDLTDMSSDWYWETDAEHRFTFLSEGLRKLGLEPEDYLGRTRWDSPGVEALDFIDWTAHRATLESHHTFADFQYCRRNSAGQLSWQSLSGRPIFDSEQRFLGYRGVGHDITERKRAEEQLRRINLTLEERVQARTRDLEAALAELESFSYSVSHDLRAPLRAIDGFSAALEHDAGNTLDERGRQYLRRTRAAAQRMGQLIDDLLELSRVGRAELNLQTVNLSALASDIARELSGTEPERKVEWQIAPDLYAQADPRLIQLVLQNLIGNAWKYTSRHASARIEFGARTSEEGEREFFVRDDGAGFDPAHAKRLFGAFQRLHRADDFPGTGVGLAIVQRIITRHGGRIRAQAAVEQGATFGFTLGSAP